MPADDGEIVVTPEGVIPKREMWLYKNPVAMALLQQGLAAAAAGNVTEPQDFSQYANDDIDD